MEFDFGQLCDETLTKVNCMIECLCIQLGKLSFNDSVCGISGDL